MGSLIAKDYDMIEEDTTEEPTTAETTTAEPTTAENTTAETTGSSLVVAETTTEPTIEATLEPMLEPLELRSSLCSTPPTIEPTQQEGMKRPRRAAATSAMERMQEVFNWEKCAESSKMFKDVANQINEEFDRASRGERSYHKRSAVASTGDGGVAVPDPPSDDERNETKDNDEVEEDSVDGSSEEEGSFVVSDNHLSQGEKGDTSSGSEDDSSSLTSSDKTDNTQDSMVEGIVDDVESVTGDSVNSEHESVSQDPTALESETFVEPALEENPVGPVLNENPPEPAPGVQGGVE